MGEYPSGDNRSDNLSDNVFWAEAAELYQLSDIVMHETETVRIMITPATKTDIFEIFAWSEARYELLFF